MKYGLCLLLLSTLGSCHQADPPGSQQNLLLGHWQCDSVASVKLDSRGRELGEPRLERADFDLDVTPTQLVITGGAIPGDTAFSTYTRRGQELTTTFTRSTRAPGGGKGQVEHAQITTLTATVFRMEKTFPLRTGPLRIRYFYHR